MLVMTPTPIPRSILAGWDVLLVEDEPDSRDVALRVLKYYGANVHLAENGHQGLDLLKSMRPRFIISDLSMPVLNGWDFVAHLKSDIRTMDIPVIALTAHAMPGDREKAMAAGFHNYLTKPLTAKTFMHNLVVLLDEIPELSAQLNR